FFLHPPSYLHGLPCFLLGAPSTLTRRAELFARPAEHFSRAAELFARPAELFSRPAGFGYSARLVIFPARREIISTAAAGSFDGRAPGSTVRDFSPAVRVASPSRA